MKTQSMLGRVYQSRYTFGVQLSQRTGTMPPAFIVRNGFSGTILGAWETLYPRWDALHVN